MRLLAAVRWLVALILVHWLIGCARKLIAGLRLGPTDPDDTFLLRQFGTTDPAVILPRVTRALRRATALQADLHALRPTEQGFSIEACRAIAAQITEICRDLGILRAKPARVAKQSLQHVGDKWRVSAPALFAQFCPPVPQPAATGPPA